MQPAFEAKEAPYTPRAPRLPPPTHHLRPSCLSELRECSYPCVPALATPRQDRIAREDGPACAASAAPLPVLHAASSAPAGMVAAARLSAVASADDRISGSRRMAGAHAAGAWVGIDQLFRAPGRLQERFGFGVEELEVGHGLELPCKCILLHRCKQPRTTISGGLKGLTRPFHLGRKERPSLLFPDRRNRNGQFATNRKIDVLLRDLWCPFFEYFAQKSHQRLNKFRVARFTCREADHAIDRRTVSEGRGQVHFLTSVSEPDPNGTYLRPFALSVGRRPKSKGMSAIC